MKPLERYSEEGGFEGGGGGGEVVERYRIGEVVDFGDGLRARIVTNVEAKKKGEELAKSEEGRPEGLFDTEAHHAAWTIAWRYFCDSCGQGRDGRWFSGNFRPTMYWGRRDESGELRNVSFMFQIEPAAEGVSSVTVCGDVGDMRVALARAEYKHYNKPANNEPLLYAE